MASGKSLEAKVLCICGQPWSSHIGKKGKLLKKYDNESHRSTAGGMGRARRRGYGVRSGRAGFVRPNLSARPKALPALATHVSIQWDSMSDEQKRYAISKGVVPPRGKHRYITIQAAPGVFVKEAK